MQAGPCTVATLDTYLGSGFSCTIGDKSFDNFGLVLASVLGTSPSAASQITVNPFGGSTNPGFNFQANYSAAGLGIAESVSIAYTAHASAGGVFTGISLSTTGAATTGLGTIVADETFCTNGAFNPLLTVLGCPLGQIGTFAQLNSVANLNAGATISLLPYGPVTQVGVLKTITLTGALLGSAHADSLNNSFTATAGDTSGVPEPTTMLLSGAGLIAVSLLGKRYRKS